MEIEEDFLEVDTPIPGQSYACLSFVSPNKVLNKKEKFMFYYYQKFRLDRYNKMFLEAFNTMVSENEDGMVELSRLMDMRKSMDELFKEDELSFEQFKEKFDDFLFRDEDTVAKQFDEMNEFKTSVRGLKVRGVYDTRREAEVRAKVLQRKDQSFDVFVGQVGYWLPWDPEGNKLEDQEYLNNDLNKLVKEYKNNEAKKDMFYQEQKAERKKDAMSTSERLRKKLEAKKKLEEEVEELDSANQKETVTIDSGISNLDGENKIEEIPDESESTQVKFDVGGNNSKAVDVDATIDTLQAEDPWLQRKREERK
jgi:hypothetical protein